MSSREYGPYCIFATGIVNSLSEKDYQLITESRAGLGQLDDFPDSLSPEQATAYDNLAHLVLAKTISKQFPNGKEKIRDLTDSEFGAVLGAAEGMKMNESARLSGITASRGARVSSELKKAFDAPNLATVVFKALIQDIILVPPRSEAPPKPQLPPKMIEMLWLIANGLSSDEIGRGTYVSAATPTGYISLLKGKLLANSRPQLVYRAFESGVWRLPGIYRGKRTDALES